MGRTPLVASLVIALGAPALAGAPGALAAAPQVQAMVVMRSGAVFGPRSVAATATRIHSSGRTCGVVAGLPIDVLAALTRAGGPGFRTSGTCDLLYVFQVGGDRARGQAGWVFKVGHRLGTVGAGDPSGPFGSGRLRSGQRVVWYWCVGAGRCQRTLVAYAAHHVGRGGRLAVRVLGYDDAGHGRPIAGATVALDGASARTGADGRATLRAPRRAGAYALRATGRGLIPAFPEQVFVR